MKSRAYIVNTYPVEKPGERWIAVWTEHDSCEILDSYGLDLTTYEFLTQFIVWLKRWPYLCKNTRALQSVKTASCGNYAIIYFMCKARRKSMDDFFPCFQKRIM